MLKSPTIETYYALWTFYIYASDYRKYKIRFRYKERENVSNLKSILTEAKNE